MHGGSHLHVHLLDPAEFDAATPGQPVRLLPHRGGLCGHLPGHAHRGAVCGWPQEVDHHPGVLELFRFDRFARPGDGTGDEDAGAKGCDR